MDNCEAWDSAAYEAARADAIARGHDLDTWRDNADSHVADWRKSLPYRERPFRFEDLAGRPEPLSWGPCYPKTASARVEKWRAINRGRELSAGEICLYGEAVGDWIRGLNAPKRSPDSLSTRTNAPSGQAGEFSAAKHRAAIRARFHAQAAHDRSQWALGLAKDSHGRTIREVYKEAMRDKRAREAAALNGEEAAPASTMSAKQRAQVAKLAAKLARREAAKAALREAA